MSTLQLKSGEEPGPPEVIKQDTVSHRSGTTWTGLTAVNGGAISSTSADLLSYHPYASTSTHPTQSRSLSAPVTSLASSSSTTTSFAAAGNGMEVSLWDVERTFAAGHPESQMNGKRKKELEEGETWRAKNVSSAASNIKRCIMSNALVSDPS